MSYQQVVGNPQQQIVKSNNEMMMQDKSNIIGEAITSMEFTMYEHGSGANNEAVNLPIPTSEPSSAQNAAHAIHTEPDTPDLIHNQAITSYNQTPMRPDYVPVTIPDATQVPTPDQTSNASSIKQSEDFRQTLNNKPEANFKFTPSPSVNQSGRISSCSNSQDLENVAQSANSNRALSAERAVGGGQPQNQLLKQLLGNCSSADNPPDGSPTLLESSSKVSIPVVGHNILPKQVGTGIPTISFQLDPSNKNNGSVGGSLIACPQSNAGPNLISSSLQPQQRAPSSTNTTLSNTTNYELKTYNVASQVQSTINLNIAPVTVRVQQVPTQVNTGTMIQKRPDAQIITRVEPPQHIDQARPTVVTTKQPLSTSIPAIKKIKTLNDDEIPAQPIVRPRSSSSTPISSGPISQSPIRPAKTPSAKRKNDYIAERRAALEKQPTPPPREIKPKKRVRGPNKRPRGLCDGNEDVKPIDSNSNTSETSQQLDNSQGPPQKKRIRKSQSKTTKLDLENSESLFTSLAIKIHNELPPISIREPDLQINNNVGSMFACGDLNLKSSRLRGPFGRATPIPGLLSRVAKKGRRKKVGFYHEEFPSNLEDLSVEAYNKRFIPSSVERNTDSPCSIVSGSSSEFEDSTNESGQEADSVAKYGDDRATFEKPFTPDLDNYIKSGSSEKIHPVNQKIENAMDVNNNTRPISPSIPIHIKLPRAQPSMVAMSSSDQDNYDNNKENFNGGVDDLEQCLQDVSAQPDASSTSLNMRLKDHGNVSVTLTLTNKEADGVKRVLNSLSQLIDYPIQSSCVLHSPQNLGSYQDDRVGLSNSFRLLTGAIKNEPTTSPDRHKDLKFNEQNYVSLDPSEKTELHASKLGAIDIKPEFCCRCKTVVVDRGIRKNISEIPEPTRILMKNSSIFSENQVEELIFCSVHCYAASIMCLGKSNDTPSKPVKVEDGEPYAVKAPPGLPPMSPMMEDDEDDANNVSKTQSEADKSKVSDKCAVGDQKIESVQRKRWIDINYTRWTPSYFHLNRTNKLTSINDIKELPLNESSSQSSSQLINQGDSSIDSNESDNSTSYCQSTSGKLGNSFDDSTNPNNLDLTVKNEESQAKVDDRYNLSRNYTLNKDVICPWPEGMELIQVRPIKRLKSANLLTGEPVPKHPKLDSHNNSPDEVEFYEDTRKCVLCHECGDGDSDGPARLLNLFVDGWVHLNCALWSLDVYELANGALMNVELACKKAMTCSLCYKPGATLKCFKPRCPNYYHFLCATKEKCSFYEDKSVQCRQHSKSAVKELSSFVVKRRVYVNRDEQRQIAEMIQGEQQNVMRIGSLVFLNIGQLLPHQLSAFHDHNNIFPVGYKVIRYYWSYRQFNKRCKYLCTIEDNDGRPQFRIVAQEHGFNDEEFWGDSAQSVWRPIIDMIVDLRKEVPDTITTFQAYIRGVDLFGLTEPSIVRILESLPGVETLTDYDFKFGRSPLLELPLAINPSGCARTEPKLRTHFKRPYTIHTASSVPKSRLQPLSSGDSSSPYIKQFVHSKSSQYRKMKSEWRNNVVLARSRVQGLGLYAARDIEKHTMVIEYIGMLIRNEIAERYERIHEAHNRGIYMFRLDEDRVIDATLAGGLARYINHSCNPNCVAEAVEIDRERKILIIANRKILKGEELGYDYKLAIEDDQHKISCLCGAPTCKKWMN